MDLKSIIEKFKHNDNKLKCGFYSGSFDPFHIGHLEVANISLEYVDFVLIVPNNPNKGKPLRLELHHRISMINKMIDGNDKLFVINDHIDDIKNILPKHFIVYGILGNEYINVATNPKLGHYNVDEWLIAPRYATSNKKKSNNINYLPYDLFKIHGASSTIVRNCIFNKQYEIAKTYINQSSFDYINNNGLYNKITTIENHLCYLIKSFYETSDIKWTYIKDNVLMVNINNKKLIAKIYFDLQIFEDEKKSYKIIPHLQTNGLAIKVPQYITSIQTDNYAIACISYEGLSTDLLINIEYDSYKIGYAIGQSLKNLHNHKMIKATSDLLSINDKLNKIKKHTEYKLVHQYYQNPGYLSYVHGDAHMGNFIINKKYKITMIDFIGIGKYNNYGIPAYEYYQFISSLSYYAFDINSVKLISNGFIDGYGKNHFTDEANLLFQTYWNIEDHNIWKN